MQITEANLKFRYALPTRERTDYIVLHHAAAVKCTIWDVHQWHLSRGWAGCGYHFFIDKDGQVFRGRPLDAEGAHCQGYNKVSVGVCAEGDYEKEKSMPGEQRNAIASLVAELLHIYPEVQVVGHRDLGQTNCPGRHYPMNEILEAVRTKLLLGKVVQLFNDVPQSHWARVSIEKLAQIGLLKGDDTGNFRPDEPLTRAQAAVLFERLLVYLGGRLGAQLL